MNDLTLQERLQAVESPIPVQPQDESFDLLEYWRAISKRRWSILGLTILVAILTMLVVSAMRPQYRSSATILIEQGKSKIVSIEEVYSQGLIQREYYQTQIEILKSEDLARKVARNLKLVAHPEFDRRNAEPSWFTRATGFFSLREEVASSDEAVLRSVVQRLRGGYADPARSQQPTGADQFCLVRQGARGPSPERPGRDVHRKRPRSAHGDDAEGGGVASGTHGRAAYQGRYLRARASGVSRTRAYR